MGVSFGNNGPGPANMFACHVVYASDVDPGLDDPQTEARLLFPEAGGRPRMVGTQSSADEQK